VTVYECPRCGMVSANPTDATEGYCGSCHDWTAGHAPFVTLPQFTVAEANVILVCIKRQLATVDTPMLWSLHTAFAEAIANHQRNPDHER